MLGWLIGILAVLSTNVSWTSASITLPVADRSKSVTIPQVAIVGAGPAGSSAAYHIQKFSERAGIAINITLWERDDRIGGRAVTVPAYGDENEPVELGASIFVTSNYILSNATREFGLLPTLLDSGHNDKAGSVIGVWNGERFVFTVDEDDSSFWNLGKLFLRYGLSPFRAQKLVEATMTSFLPIYESPNFPFKSLTAVAMDLGLNKLTGITGQQLLKERGIGTRFANEIIQAGTRVNYAANLGFIHGLDSMVAIAPEGSIQIFGGNWRIFSNMVERSGAYVLLGTPVTSISQLNLDGKAFYSLQHRPRDSVIDTTYPVRFDAVILACPYQFSNISLPSDLLSEPIDEIPYADLHVTLFTTRLSLSPDFFNLPTTATLPTTILTTLSDTDKQASFPSGVGKAGFYSISLLRTVTNPQTGRQENLYKIFSPAPLTASFLSKLLGSIVSEEELMDCFGVKLRSTPKSCGGIDGEKLVSWCHSQVFHAYPIPMPRVTFQDPILAPGLYYSSGMESFISTMETSALSGMNIARLVVNELALPSEKPSSDDQSADATNAHHEL